MTVPPPEYDEDDRLRQEPGRVRQQPGDVLPLDREDAPEREIGQHDRQGREVEYLDPEDHEAHPAGRPCGRCGATITAGQDARREAGGQWIHEVCPADRGSRRVQGQWPPVR